jgi:hypothetical protein
MPYVMRIFCASGGSAAADILDRIEAGAQAHGEPLWLRDREAKGTGGAATRITEAGRESGDGAVYLEVHAASGRFTAATIRQLSAERPGIDAYVTLTLPPGDAVDWKAVRAVWTALKSLWPVLPHDDGSGFDVDMDELDQLAAEG